MIDLSVLFSINLYSGIQQFENVNLLYFKPCFPKDVSFIHLCTFHVFWCLMLKILDINCRQFLLGLQKYGKGDWRNISRNYVTTRTPTQVASHAQKYFIRQSTGGKDKRRSSIHDITTVNLPDARSPSPENRKPSSPDHSTTTKQSQAPPITTGMVKGLFDWKPQNEGTATVFNPANGNLLMAPFCGISSYGSKLQEQNLLGGALPGYQFGPYNLIFQMQSMQHH